MGPTAGCKVSSLAPVNDPGSNFGAFCDQEEGQWLPHPVQSEQLQYGI